MATPHQHSSVRIDIVQESEARDETKALYDEIRAFFGFPAIVQWGLDHCFEGEPEARAAVIERIASATPPA